VHREHLLTPIDFEIHDGQMDHRSHARAPTFTSNRAAARIFSDGRRFPPGQFTLLGISFP
jgi:hypothetical protein